MKTLYLECSSGISGDMTVAALLDLGADPEVLHKALGSLGLDGYKIHINKVTKSGITAMDFQVELDEGSYSHAPLDSHEHIHEHGPSGHCHETHSHHEDGNGHSHSHAHPTEDDGGNGHEHIHRNLGDVLEIIRRGSLTAGARVLAEKAFRIVAEAEAKVHGLPVMEVHFHEVGVIDSIVDIVSAAVCLDNLDIGAVCSTPLSEGQGHVHCQHGIMPVPAPATMEIAAKYKLPLTITDNQGEMVTPTGIAILAALEPVFTTPSGMVLEAIGYGAGKRAYKQANLLRASLLGAGAGNERDRVTELSANIDDMTGEALGYAVERLLEAGALDVWTTPIQMKKSRPGILLSVLAKPEDSGRLTREILVHTSTIGVRRSEHVRTIMERCAREVEICYGTVRVKDCSYGDVRRTTVEYESAKELALAQGISLESVYREASRLL